MTYFGELNFINSKNYLNVINNIKTRAFKSKYD